MTQSKANPVASDALIRQCISHLENEKSVLVGFLNLSERLQNELANDLAPDIDSVSQIEQQLVAQSTAVAGDRDKLRSQVADHFGITVPQASIKYVIEHTPDESASELVKLRQEILEAQKAINRLNRSNSLLLQHSIELYQRIIGGIIGSAGPSTTTYDHSGHLKQTLDGNLVQTDC